nr:hypothetical protein [uncultured Pseudodesulfovibrio sp.]
MLRLVTVLGFLLLVPTLATSADSLDVILLHSESSSTEWTKSFASGLESGLGSVAQVHQEFLGQEDMDEDHFDTVYQQLLEAHLTPQVVITDGRIAFAFARKYGPSLFPDAPVLFCSIPRPTPEVLSSYKNCTGLPVEHSMQQVVDLIFTLRPETRTVVGIADSTATGKARMKAVVQAMQPYMDQAQLIFPGYEAGDDEGMRLDDLSTVLSSVPSRGVTLFLGFSEDRQGSPVLNETMASILKSRTASPTFVLDDSFMGTGVVGGLLISGNAVGQDAARLVKKILQGENIQEMLPQPVHGSLILDGKALARFGISPPEGATVVNPPETVSEPENAISTNMIGWFFGILLCAGLFFLFKRYKP